VNEESEIDGGVELDEMEDCPNCGGTGYSSHECGEDCCACAYPEDNVICDWCDGKG